MSLKARELVKIILDLDHADLVHEMFNYHIKKFGTLRINLIDFFNKYPIPLDEKTGERDEKFVIFFHNVEYFDSVKAEDYLKEEK